MYLSERRANGISVVLCKDIVDIVNGKSSVNVLVDRENGSKTAGSYAAAGFKRELAVGSTASAVDAELFDKLVVDIAASLNVARSSEAYGNFVLTLGVERELSVKSDYPVDLFKGIACFRGNYLLHLNRKITVDLLRLLSKN